MDGNNRSILDPACGTGNFSSVIPECLQNAKFTGVEIDSITARISRQLYQRNKVIYSGFETSCVKDNSYDVVIGNVPFNEIRVFDRKYGNSFYVHDYFFIKSLDVLKPGGVAALITSKGTMDKKDHTARLEIPAEEIAFIHDCKTDTQRENLFEKVRAGEVRVLLGSTQKLGMGTNVQDKLYAIHHLDCPWRPIDIIQRNGRGKRYGNKNTFIRIFQYVTKGTFDSYLWQIQEQKLRYITQVMTHKAITRSCEDVDITVLNAAEVKAIATNNPLLLEKMTTENEVTRLTILRSAWQNEQALLERSIGTTYPERIKDYDKSIAKVDKDIETIRVNTGKDFLIELDGREYTERAKAGKMLTLHMRMFLQQDNQDSDVANTVIGSFGVIVL